MSGPVHINRRRLDRRINLSSNELLSQRLESIHRSVVGSLASPMLSRYPATADAVPPIAYYFGLSPEGMVLTPGSDSALRLVCAYYANRNSNGGTILLQDPNYIAWEEAARSRRLAVRRVRAEFADPVEQGERLVALAESTSNALIALSAPNGFSGGCPRPADLDELVKISASRGHLLVIDACYQAFNGPLAGQLARSGGPVLVVQSLSKSHGLAGARIAVVAGAPKLIAELEAGPLEHAVSGPTLWAARNAIDHHDELDMIWSEVRKTRTWCMERLRRAGLRPLPSSANFVTTWLGTPETTAAVTKSLSEAGYRVRDLSSLSGLSGCLRFTIADPEITEPFIEILESTLRSTSSHGV